MGIFSAAQFNETSLICRNSGTCNARLCSSRIKSELPLIRGTSLFKKFLILGSVGGGAYFFSTMKNSQIKINIRRDVDDIGLRQMIIEIVNHGDERDIKELIKLLRNPKINFPNIDQQYYIWELVILEELIELENVEMIRKIFPLFRPQTLSYVKYFYEPLRKGKLDLIKAMIDGGMDLFGDPNYSDVFLYSLYLGKLDIARYLLETKKYDLNKAYSFSIEDIENRKQFSGGNAYNRITPAYLAVAMNNPKTLEFLIELGADCNLPNEESVLHHDSQHDADNPLICSVRKGYEDCFKVLINIKNINLNFCDALGKTPLLVALFEKKSSMAQALIAKGADVNIPNSFLITPIMLAVRSGDIPVVQDLLKAEANPRCIDDLKRNLWHHATNSKSAGEICNLLRDCGIQDIINDEDGLGNTPLSCAVENANPMAVLGLLISGADINKKLENLGEYKRESLHLQKGEVTIHEFAAAELKSLETYHEKYPKNAEYYHKIVEMKVIITILKNPPQLLEVSIK